MQIRFGKSTILVRQVWTGLRISVKAAGHAISEKVAASTGRFFGIASGVKRLTTILVPVMLRLEHHRRDSAGALDFYRTIANGGLNGGHVATMLKIDSAVVIFRTAVICPTVRQHAARALLSERTRCLSRLLVIELIAIRCRRN